MWFLLKGPAFHCINFSVALYFCMLFMEHWNFERYGGCWVFSSFIRNFQALFSLRSQPKVIHVPLALLDARNLMIFVFVSENPCGVNFDVSTKSCLNLCFGTWRLSAIVAFANGTGDLLKRCQAQIRRYVHSVAHLARFAVWDWWSHATRSSFSRGLGCYWRQRMFSSDVSFIWSSLIPRRWTR